MKSSRYFGVQLSSVLVGFFALSLAGTFLFRHLIDQVGIAQIDKYESELKLKFDSKENGIRTIVFEFMKMLEGSLSDRTLTDVSGLETFVREIGSPASLIEFESEVGNVEMAEVKVLREWRSPQMTEISAQIIDESKNRIQESIQKDWNQILQNNRENRNDEFVTVPFAPKVISESTSRAITQLDKTPKSTVFRVTKDFDVFSVHKIVLGQNAKYYALNLFQPLKDQLILPDTSDQIRSGVANLLEKYISITKTFEKKGAYPFQNASERGQEQLIMKRTATIKSSSALATAELVLFALGISVLFTAFVFIFRFASLSFLQFSTRKKPISGPVPKVTTDDLSQNDVAVAGLTNETGKKSDGIPSDAPSNDVISKNAPKADSVVQVPIACNGLVPEVQVPELTAYPTDTKVIRLVSEAEAKKAKDGPSVFNGSTWVELTSNQTIDLQNSVTKEISRMLFAQEIDFESTLKNMESTTSIDQSGYIKKWPRGHIADPSIHQSLVPTWYIFIPSLCEVFGPMLFAEILKSHSEMPFVETDAYFCECSTVNGWKTLLDLGLDGSLQSLSSNQGTGKILKLPQQKNMEDEIEQTGTLSDIVRGTKIS